MFQIDATIKQLEPYLQQLETERLKIKRTLKHVWTALAVCGLFLAGSMAFDQPILTLVSVAACVITTVWKFYRYSKQKSHYVVLYKQTVIPHILQIVDNNLQYSSHSGHSLEQFRQSELFKKPDRYTTEDLIFGYHGKTQLRMAEVLAESEYRDGNGNSAYRTIFQGVLLVADFHKNFHGRTFVFPDSAERLFGNFGRKFQKLSGHKNTQLVQLEDPDFEKAFVVHASDQVEARYILSLSMMQNLLNLRAKFNNAKIRMAFKDSALWLALPNTNQFLEPNFQKPATDPEQINYLLYELQIFLEIVEELDLNTRIWTRQ